MSCAVDDSGHVLLMIVIQDNPFITLWLGSMEWHSVIRGFDTCLEEITMSELFLAPF